MSDLAQLKRMAEEATPRKLRTVIPALIAELEALREVVKAADSLRISPTGNYFDASRLLYDAARQKVTLP